MRCEKKKVLSRHSVAGTNQFLKYAKVLFQKPNGVICLYYAGLRRPVHGYSRPAGSYILFANNVTHMPNANYSLPAIAGKSM